MARKWPQVLLGAGLMLSTVGAWAQVQNSQQGRERGMQYGQHQAMHNMQGTNEPGMAVKSKDVIGKEVWDNQNNKLGDLENIVIDLNNGRALFGILNGKYVSKNDQYVPVPITAFRYRQDRNGSVLNVSKNELTNAPSFNENDWPNLTEKSYVEQVYSHYNLPNPMMRMHTHMQGMMQGMRGQTHGQNEGETHGKMAEGPTNWGTWAKATDLLRKEVVDTNGNKLGDLTNLVLDFNTGQALFGILPGNYVDKRDQDIAIPITALRFTDHQKELALNVTKNQVADAPAFNQRSWPNMTERSFIDRVYTHFNVPSPFASAQELGQTGEGTTAMR
jgi:sporulation protein YlmC with PRC-barrel domain